jgi:hypothetical protein
MGDDSMATHEGEQATAFILWANYKLSVQVYLGAIAGYLPLAMVHCISKFISACYIAWWNVISAAALDRFQKCVVQFHELHNIFITTKVHKSIS